MKKRSAVKRIGSVLGCIVLVALLVLIGVCAWMISQQKVPQLFGYSVLRVVTGSMEPALDTGSCVIVRKTDPAALREGDIISFYSPEEQLGGAPVTHRILRIEQTGEGTQFITKGDANNAEDETPVPAELLIGRVSSQAVVFEWITKLVSSPASFLLVIVIPLVGIMLWEIRNLVKAGRADDDEK